jgi:AbrB family looped-hinge helix DNA binding protein
MLTFILHNDILNGVIHYVEGSRMTEFIRSKVSDAGRVVIPAELRKEFGIEEGEDVVFSKDEHGIRIITLREAIRQAQDYFGSLVPPGVSLSDELLRDRREEAAREDRG